MSGRAGLLPHVRRNLGRGLFLILPLLITLWLLALLFRLVDQNVTPAVRGALESVGIVVRDNWISEIAFAVLSLLLTALVIYLLGLFVANLTGRRLVRLLESWILRVPVVKGIYGSARQLLDSFRMTGERSFSKVVLLEYPRRSLWTVGFVTSDREHSLLDEEGRRVPALAVFLPTTPNPTSGLMILVPSRDLVELDISIEEAIKMIVSGGIVSPGDLGRLTREASDDGSSQGG